MISSVFSAGDAPLSDFKGNYAVDGTLVKANGTRGTDNWNQKFVATEYDAGRYYRDSLDHTEAALGKKSPQKAKNWWGYELTIVTTLQNKNDGTDPTVPHLITGLAFDGAGREPGMNAVRAFKPGFEAGLPSNLVVADRAYYANAVPSKFHIPMASMGFKPVTDYKKNQLGKQEGHKGAIQVDGWWYCPTMPEGLVNASRDFMNGKIDEVDYEKRLAARKKYAATRKDRMDEHGTTRWAHPTEIGHRCDPNRPGAGEFCTQKTVSFGIDAGFKFTQEFPYKSEKWKAAYALRSTVESVNAGLKRASTHGLDNPERRRLRGRTAQFFLVALTVMARNIESLLDFKKRQTDPDYALKIARKKALRLRTSYNNATHDDGVRVTRQDDKTVLQT